MKALITTQDGQVKTLNGKAYVMSNGQQVPLQQGDFVAQGSEVFVDNDAQIELLLSDGSSLGSEAEVPQEALQSADSATDSEIAQLQALIASGEDPTASLPDTAAGGAQGNEGTSGFVSLARSGAETLAASGYDSAGVEADAITLQDGLSQNTFELTQVAPSTVTLLAPTQVNEGGSITYTAVVDNAPLESDLVLTLSNGATIVIPVGQTSGSVTVDAPSDDVYLDSEVLNVGVTESQGGNYENLDLGNSVDTQVNDTIDTTTVTLTAPAEVNEGGQITYTATVNNAPETDLVLTLSNGASITIAAGQTEGTVTVDAPTDDVYQDGEILTVGITDAQGGNYEDLNLGNSVDTQVNDTIDTTAVTLTAPAEVNEGGQITYTATVNNAPETDLVLTLSNGASITIAAGQTEGTVTVDAPTDDVYQDGEILTVGITDAQGGNYEDLNLGNSVDTQVNDTIDTTTVTLTAPAEVNEGGQITYTATVNNAPETDLVLTLSNGASITIAAGQTSGTVTVDAPSDDVFVDAETLTVGIDSAQGGNFENLDTSDTASTLVNDTTDTVFAQISVDKTSVAEGGEITYTVTLVDANGNPVTLPSGASVTLALDWSGTASAADVDNLPPSVTITGDSQQSFTVNTINDGVYENSENLSVVISGVTDVDNSLEQLEIGSNNSADTTILDAQDAPVVGIVADQSSVTEGETAAFTVSIDQVADEDVVVNFTYSGVAEDGTDFTGVASVTIPAGSTSVPLDISTINDGIYEGAEDFTVTINSVSGADASIGANNSADTTILDAQDAPVVGIVADQSSVTEGETAAFTVSIDQVADEDVVVNFTYSGVAEDGTDFTGVASVTIPAGSTSVPLDISTINDGIYEGAEDFTVTINSVSGADASIGANNSADTTILDAQDAPVVGIVADQSSVTEGETAAFTVSIDQVADEDVVVNFTYSGVAEDGSDFTGVASVTIPAGSTSVPLDISTINDGIYEGAEDFTVTIDSVSGADAGIGANNSADTTILDAQDAPVVGIVAEQSSVTEGETAAFTVSIDQVADEDVVVNFTYSGVAEDGSDFTGVASVTIPAGSTSVPLDISTINDGIYEGAEDFTVTIDSVSGADAGIGANNSADTTILDAQDAPVVGIVAEQSSVTEGETAAFTVSIDQVADEDVVVNFTYSGVAEDGTDFTGVASVTIPAGSTSVPLDISTINDGIYEGAEDFTVTIDSVSGADATISPTESSADTTILDAQDAPVVGIVADQSSVTEGETAAFTVSIDQVADEDVVVNFTYSGVAEDGTDFTGVASVTIPAGSTSVPLDISTINDGIYEGAEDFTVTIDSVSGADATISPTESSADTTILDAQDAPVVGIVADQSSVTEGETAAFTVSIDQVADEDVVVNFTYSGVAEDGSDFTGVASVTIPAGSTSVPLDISTINDGIYEGAEDFTVTIDSVSGADATISPTESSADTTILDAQDAPVVGIVADQSSVTEGETAAFTVSIDQVADEDVVVNFTYSGVAEDGTDFTGVASVTIPAGSTSVPLDISTINDGIYEGAEDFTVTINSVSGADASIGANNSADTTILDAQDAPVVGIVADQSSVTEGETAAFTVSIDQVADEDVVVNFTYSGVAEDGTDFTGVASVTIPAGSTSVPLDISTINDGIYEGAEDFTVTIDSVSGADATISPTESSADTTILDAQDAPVVGIVADQSSVTEGETAAFTVSIDQVADEDVVVNFTYSGVAEDGTDFTGVASVTIPAGSTSVPLDISTINDGIYEGAEDFTVTINSVSGADAGIGANNSADTTILDAQDAPVVGIVADQSSVTEGETAAFTVSIDQVADEDVVVNFTYSGVAEDGSDFTGVASVTIPAGSTSVPLDISTINDGIYEGAEDFTVTIDSVSGADASIGANNSADTTILDAQDAPVVGIVADQSSVTEGETAAFTVSIDQVADEDVVVNFTYSGVAEDGSDFTGVASVTIPAGSTSVPLDISTINDGIYEGAEDFTVTIDSVSGADATISPTESSADTTILDAQDAPVVGIVADQSSVTEGETAAFTVSIDQVADEDVVVNFTYSGVAEDGTDFTGVASVTIPAGSTSVPLDISTINDGIYEGAEDFTVTINSVSGADASIGANNSADTTILDAQDAPVVGIVADQSSVTEGETAAFTVSIDQVADEDVVVNFTYSGVAEDGTDFTGVASVTIPAGSTSVPLDISTINDGIYEGAEDFTVTINSVSGADASIGANNSADTTILDAQDAPVVGIVADQSSVTEGETAAFTVSIDQVADEDVVVNFTYSGVAEDGSDFTGVASVTIPAGSTSVPLDISTINDGIYEGAEDFTVTIDSVSGADASIGANNSADTTILDAQDAPVVGIVADQSSVTEGETAAFTVSIDQVADEDVVVNFTYSGVAEDGTDFTGVASVTIPAGSTSVPLDISTINDGIYEGAEDFTVTINSVSGADASIGANNSADTTILDAQDAPVVGIVADQSSVTEGETAAFTVSIDQVADEDVVVNFTYSGVAEDGTDFTGVASVTIPAGSTSVPLDISTINDGIYEGAEDFTVTIDSVSGADASIGANNSADTTILDAQDAPVVGIVADQSSVTEGETAAFTVSIDQVADEDVVVNFTYSGVAEDGSDFTGVASVTIPAGSTSVPLDISTINDGIYEGAEDFTVTIDSVSGADASIGANNSADTTILDAQDAPVVGIVADQSSVTEGETAAFTVSIDQVADEDVVVNFTYSGVAEDGTDFTGVASVTIPAGSTSVPLDISTINDGIYEGAEDFTVTIDSVSGADASIGANNSADTTILDAQDAPVVGIVADQSSVTEGETAAFTVSIDQVADEDVVVNFTYSGVAEDGSDFTGVASVTIPAGSTSVPLDISTINDGIYEGAEDFTVTIDSVSGADASIGANNSADTTILDAQDAPVVGIVADQSSVTEGETAAFTVSIDQVADEDVVVNFTYSGVAEDGTDFTGVASVTIPAGSTSVPLDISTINDGIYEGAEDFTVTIDSVSGADASIGANNSADTTILDAQDAPVVGIVADQSSVTEGETAAFTVSIDQVADEDVVVNFTYSGVAEDGSDFTGVASVTIPAGSTSVPLDISTINDGIYEGAEDFTVTINSVSGADASIGANNSADTTILDAQNPPSIGNITNVAVSEEGLTDGAPDDVGDTDTTDAVIANGTIELQDPDNDELEVTLSGPSGITSGGVDVTWSWDASTQTLTGSAGSTVVMTISLTAPAGNSSGTWGYEVTLHAPLDHPVANVEDVLNLNFGIDVADGSGATDSSSFQVTVEDDSPVVDVEPILDGVNTVGTYTGVMNTSGADKDYSADLSGNVNGWDAGSQTYFGASDITAGGKTVFFFVDPNNPDQLFAYTSDESPATAYDASNPDQTLIFTLNTDPNSDSYQLDILQSIDKLEEIDIGALDGGKGGISGTVYVTYDNATGAYNIYNDPSKVPSDAEVAFTLYGRDGNGDLADVNGTDNGFGVANPWVSGGETLIVDYADTVASASFNFNVGNNDPVLVHYKAYDANGQLLGEGEIGPNEVISDLGAIAYIELSAVTPDGAKFQLTGTTAQEIVSSTEPLDLDFGVVVTDSDGDQTNGNLDIHLDAPGGAPVAITSYALASLDEFGLQDDNLDTDQQSLRFKAGDSELSDFGFNYQNGDFSGITVEGIRENFPLSWRLEGEYLIASMPGNGPNKDVLKISLDWSAIAAGSEGNIIVNAELIGNLPHNIDVDSLKISGIEIVGTDNNNQTAVSTLDVKVEKYTAAVDDYQEINEDQLATGNIFDNDTGEFSDGQDIELASFTVAGDSQVYIAGEDVTVEGGTLVINLDGSYTFTPEANWNGTVPVITYVTNNGDTATLTIKVNSVNDAPTIVTTTNAVVSEEGLTNGLPDSNGSSDTTDSATANGTIQLQDVDGDVLTVSLTPPSGITSGGQAVTWQWDVATNTLTGSVGNLAVMTVVLTPPAGNGSGDWDYQVNLLGPIDHPDTSIEDVKDLTFGVSVNDGNGGTVSGSFVVSVEDDAPYMPDTAPVTATATDIPDTLIGAFDLTGYTGNRGELDFNGFTITARGFTSSTDHTLTSTNINGSSSGIGVASVGSPYHNIANEVDFREFADGTGVSEEVIIDLDPNTLAFGMKIEFANIFGGELESGVVEFWRDGQLISTQTFSSDAGNGDYAADFNVQDGGFDRVVIKATDNGTAPSHGDNSDFTISSIEFTGTGNAPAIAYASGEVTAQWGADGQGSLALAGVTDTSLVTASGEAVEVTLSGNTLLGQTDSGDLVFKLEFTPGTGHWDFYQYQTMQGTEDGDLDFAVTVTDADGDSYTGNIAVVPVFNYQVTEAGPGDQTVNLGNSEDIVIGDLDGTVVVPGQDYNIAFMVDSSGSINTSTLNTMKSQLAQVFETLKDSAGGEQSGTVKIFLVDFDTHAKGSISVDLNDPNALSTLQNALNDMSSGGGTNYEDVFTTTANWFANGDAQDNSGATNLAFFITDGKPTYYNANAGGNPKIYDTWWSGNDRSLSQVIGAAYVFGQVYTVNGHVVIDESGNVFSVEDFNNVSRSPVGAMRPDAQGNYDYYALAGTGSSTNSDTTANSEAGFALLSGLGVTVEAIGMGSNIDEDDLQSYDTDGNVQTNIDADELADAILGNEITNMPGSDTLDGGAGNDIIFGDVIRFDGIQGQGYNALKAFIAGELGQSDVTDAEIHNYISEHSNLFDKSSANDKGDIIRGGDGSDILFGQGGNDELYGGNGNDMLFGGNGNDLLVGGNGDDWLTGGQGVDTFSWKAGETGTDHITDFELNKDQLNLSDLLLGEEHNSLEQYFEFSVADGNTTISIDADLDGEFDQHIVLDGVDLFATYGSDESDIINGLLGNSGDGPLIVDTQSGNPGSSYVSQTSSSGLDEQKTLDSVF
ncbi:immunoglobulin-like domain-containing protein [Shewanella algae]|uniref:VWA domain-containing protein n=11 Tax=Shewanella algae TaxID=38313 RepID=A0A7T8EFB2_9GAMM|nr:VWA domain-containing protein [Shewanella algae]